jgi:hypothetical protein
LSRLFKNLLLVLFLVFASSLFADDLDILDLVDAKDLDVLVEDDRPIEVLNNPKEYLENLEASRKEEIDDLDALKSDLNQNIIDDDDSLNGELGPVGVLEDPSDKSQKKKLGSGSLKLNDIDPGSAEASLENKVPQDVIDKTKSLVQKKNFGIFDTGKEERKLIEISKFLQGKIPGSEWDEISSATEAQKYVVQEGETLWGISKKLFGSGFYYSKIWSLNPYITNPHEIEPGMTLVLSSGGSDAPPEIRTGEFVPEDLKSLSDEKLSEYIDFDYFGEETEPKWIQEKKDLIKQGVFVQYASVATYDDLKRGSLRSLNREYEKYEPPLTDIEIQLNDVREQYDETGFDKNSKIQKDIKEGFSLHTFVSTNLIQDYGEVDSFQKASITVDKFDIIYLNITNLINVAPGDKFSLYSAGGKVSHELSDRKGFKFTIVGQAEILRKKNHLWEARITDTSGLIQRLDRVTAYTPRIARITSTFNPRNIEAIITASYSNLSSGVTSGDVVYLDRGRADGVEMGNVFEVFSFTDPGTEERITPDPTFKIGEVTVITLADNFSTALVTYAKSDIHIGAITITKSPEKAAISRKKNNDSLFKEISGLESKALEELDVELNLDDVSEDLLKKAEKIRLTEEELEELERIEREKSILKDHEKDLYELEKLEREIESAEAQLNETKIDEDRYLEGQNLNKIEGTLKSKFENNFQNLNEIEKSAGKKYLDEDLNSKENPYGLTEFDIEEIDELLNSKVTE